MYTERRSIRTRVILVMQAKKDAPALASLIIQQAVQHTEIHAQHPTVGVPENRKDTSPERRFSEAEMEID